jgi:O-antigen/teichoic acid export membrane protein
VSGIATLVTVRRSLRQADGMDDGPELGELIRFGSKGLLGWVSPIEGIRVDQQVVGIALSPAALGLYVVAQSFTNLPRFIAQSIGMVGYPVISAESSAHDARRAMWQCFWIAVALCSALVVSLELLAPTLVHLFYGHEFSGAITITRVLLVAALLMSVRRVLAEGARGLGRPAIGTVAEASMWVVLLPLLPILAASNGATGVAVALTLGAALALVVIAVPLALQWPPVRTAPGLAAVSPQPHEIIGPGAPTVS